MTFRSRCYLRAPIGMGFLRCSDRPSDWPSLMTTARISPRTNARYLPLPNIAAGYLEIVKGGTKYSTELTGRRGAGVGRRLKIHAERTSLHATSDHHRNNTDLD